jgi:parallel beta-helix repeat protein
MGSCIEIRNSFVYFRIENCILFNARFGSSPLFDAAIKLIDTNNGTLYNNTCSNNNGKGIFIRKGNNNSLIENKVENNGGAGIYIVYSYIKNYLFNNSIIFNGQNSKDSSGEGLILKYCNNHVINGNSIIGNNRNIGFLLWDSHNNTISDNTISGHGDGIHLYETCNDNKLVNNRITMNKYDGIQIDVGENNEIGYNNVSNNIEHGINVFGDNNKIHHNNVYNNGKSGIYVHDCEYVVISSNTVNNNSENGILLDYGWIFLDFGCYYHNILNNIIEYNKFDGIHLSYATNINISRNSIRYNSIKGISLDLGSTHNLLYNNTFINNGLNAIDGGSSNWWNNSIIGNFWDDYNGSDTNDDKIGDSPHNISGSANEKDWLPIWWDAPEILFEISNYYLNTTKPEYFHEGLEIKCNLNDSSNLFRVYLCENSTGEHVNRPMINNLNGNWTYTINISFLEWNNKISFYFFANDSFGLVGINDSRTSLYTVKIFDFQKPNSSIFFVPHYGTNHINQSTQFTLLADDNLGSGIKEIRYKINDSIWFEFNNPFNLSLLDFGHYIISCYSIDAAGTVGDYYLIHIVLIDTSEEKPGGAIPGYDLFLLTGIFCLISIIYFRKRNFHKYK